MKPTDEQARVVRAESGVAVVAGAGTGKTRTLVLRYLELIERKCTPLQLVAVTFTEAAAGELRSRLRRSLAGRHPELLPELEAAPIGTLHGLAARICREHPREAGVAADFRVQDEAEATLWLRERLPLALAGLPDHIFDNIPASILKESLQALLADPLAAKEAFQRGAEEMRKALRAEHERLFKEAGPILSLLESLVGPQGDKMEDQRRRVLAAAEEGPGALWEAVQGVNLRIGSQARWGQERFKEVKEHLSSLRKSAKKAVALRYSEEHERAWNALREAFQQVYEHLEDERRAERVLDFAGLEVHALKALENAEVRAYYQDRWKHALVDEHQDTNPVQGRLLAALFEPHALTVVGDPKQSIYGFRRADPRVFARALEEAPEQVRLSRSFRTHRGLVEEVNAVFKGLLEEHEPLTSERKPPDSGPHLEAFVIDSSAPIGQKRQAEAREIARRIRRWLEEGLPVWDREDKKARRVRRSDFAVIARTWSILEGIALALLAEGIPAVISRGEGLLGTREAKDGLALLRFLANSSDDLALVAVLRSPFFAVSDSVLQEHAAGNGSWWRRVKESKDPALNRAREVLEELHRLRRREAPSRLLQQADRLTGYTAVLANLPLAERRLADWSGFLDLVRDLERGNADAFVVARRLGELKNADIRIERPPLAAEDAVSLLTVHASKGLEWPVVFLAGLDSKSKRSTSRVLFEPEFGVGIHLDEEGPDGIYHLLSERQEKLRKAERYRSLYVGMTRAADRLVLSAAANNEVYASIKDRLPGLETIEPKPSDLQPPFPDPPRPPVPTKRVTKETGPVIEQMAVTALDDYRLCPRRFYLAHVRGHPGAGEAPAYARRVGEVVHTALARNLPVKNGPEDLRSLDPTLPQEHLEEAAAMVRRYYAAPVFKEFREKAEGREVPLVYEVDGFRLDGRADLVGPDWVVDFKTGEGTRPEDHALQLWAYARALEKQKVYLADLRQGKAVRVSTDGMKDKAYQVVKGIREGDFHPTPSPQACTICPYRVEQLCPEGGELKLNKGENTG